ncbi:chemotaxis protein CheB [Pseudoduganella violacea]|uniref:protein-glutamate methylesterase n=1 Tax=Pseudoduganella violacea TaxID=1715466 RepID=A0A7W5FSG4_9BURK|nr:chemotaxis protein CheB [Pseudoduganella violacea]MBB3117547.1 two-component system chemotaxis response regulator CheB [Pseudoduganella violacea]
MDTRAAIAQVLRGRQIDAVAIGGSAGGVNALLQILPGLPPHFSRPVIVVLHVQGGRQSQLAEVFQRQLSLPVREAGDKEIIVPGTLYFAPSDYHLSVETDGSFSLSCEPPVNFARPAIDLMMASAADTYGAGLLGILLTGANHDGAAGLAAIGEAGGVTVAQNPDDAMVGTMPEEAIRLRMPDLILPLSDIRSLLSMLENT